MMPGTTVRLRRSMIRRPAAGLGAAPPTAANRPLRIVTVATTLFFASIVWMLPLTKTSSSTAAGCASTAPTAAAKPMAEARPSPSSRLRDTPFVVSSAMQRSIRAVDARQEIRVA